MKSWLMAFAFAFVMAATPAQAHKVIASVFPSGDSIEGEIGFSNGDMAANTTVEVFDPDGNKLGETQTDEDGFFVFTPNQNVAHVFKANLGAGHVAEATMEQAEVAGILGKQVNESEEAETVVVAEQEAVTTAPAATITVAALTDEERTAIATAVRDEIRPLRREIAAYKEHHDIQSILGGIGYIAGLFGLGFYLAARRRIAG